MQAFVINMDGAIERWRFVADFFARQNLPIQRVAAIDGLGLRFPIPEYAEARYRSFHGRETNPREVGCYLSHIKAMRTFLATEDSHAFIFEDDTLPGPDFHEVLNQALAFSHEWNILRLTGLKVVCARKVVALSKDYDLCVSLGRLKGAGAYLLDRTGAETLVTRLLPMWLPFDHALDREWQYGLRAACVLPFPCSQTNTRFRTLIQKVSIARAPFLQRRVTTYCYQFFNELTRCLFRGTSYLQMKLAIAARRRSKQQLAFSSQIL